MKIAVIGSGISGLGAAYLLNPYHDVVVYEKNDYIGGHSRTVDLHLDGKNVPVDTGFIVFNYRNYPNLTGLFKYLNVPIAYSDMSFGVSIDKGWLEYGTRRPFDIFAQKRNLLRPHFWKMLTDILKFNARAPKYLNSDCTLGECLQELKLGRWFYDYYLLAMAASIWSTSPQGMLKFPASSFVRFFSNHGLLTVSDQPQWYTVKGGSKEYVKRLVASFQHKIKLNCGVSKVVRKVDHVEVFDEEGNTRLYDQVIFACHSDQALKLLTQPTAEEQSIIGAISYQPNDMVLHSDTRFMQKRKGAYSSWVYLSQKEHDAARAVSLSYWMNNLQPLPTKKTILVTLNPGWQPDFKTIYDQFLFHHPVFDQPAIAAQKSIHSIQGLNRTWYTGAWQRYGFHEDGLASAVAVAEKMGVKIPWK